MSKGMLIYVEPEESATDYQVVLNGQYKNPE
jgi:hypothetical protein